MSQTPKRRVIFLGSEQELPASLAERLVARGEARYAETVSAPAAPEKATAEAPERATKPAPRRRPAAKKRGSSK